MPPPRRPSTRSRSPSRCGGQAPNSSCQCLWGTAPMRTTNLTGHSPIDPLTDEPMEGWRGEAMDLPFTDSATIIHSQWPAQGPASADHVWRAASSARGSSVRGHSQCGHTGAPGRGLECPGGSKEAKCRGGLRAGGGQRPLHRERGRPFRPQESQVQRCTVEGGDKLRLLGTKGQPGQAGRSREKLRCVQR